MKRLLLALLAVAVVALGAMLRADEAPKVKADDKAPIDIKNEAAAREMVIAQKYREFELALVQLAQRLEKSTSKEDRDKALVLRQALETAGKSGVTTRMESLIALLRESKANNLAEIKEAIDQGERVVKDMQEMLALILKDGALERNQLLQKRLADLIKALEAIIRAQKVVRVHTEKRSLEQPMIGKAQDKIVVDTDNFKNDMEDKSKPGFDRLPGKDLVVRAIGDEKAASGNITANKNDDASENQTAAIDKLTQVRDALIKLLAQIRDQERQAILASLQARLELMLQLQIEVRDGTVALDKAIAGNVGKKPGRTDHQKAIGLSDREGTIVAEADTAIKIVKAEGSAIAFLEVFQQLRQDMANVQGRLAKTEAGVLTQTIEQDIIDTLKEMIDAVKKAQQPQPPMPPTPNDPNVNRPPVDQTLLQKIAELKLIRSRQFQLNKRTETYGKQYDGEEPADPTLRKEVRGLAEMQQKLQEITQGLYTKRNE